MMKSLWASVQNDPTFMRRFNGWATIIWFIAAIPICLFLADSVPFLVFISVYAVVTGHLSSWQAARVEVRQEEEDIAKDVVKEIEKDPNIPTENHTTGEEEPDDLESRIEEAVKLLSNHRPELLADTGETRRIDYPQYY